MDYTEQEKDRLLEEAEWVPLDKDLFPHQWSYYLKMKFTLRWDSDYDEWQVLEAREDEFYSFLQSLSETCSIGKKRGRKITAGQFKIYCLAEYDSEKKEWIVPLPLKDEAIEVWKNGLEVSSIYPAIKAQKDSRKPDVDMQMAIIHQRTLSPKQRWMKMVEYANHQCPGSVLYAYLDTDGKTVLSNASADEIDYELEKYQVRFTIICPRTKAKYCYVWDRMTMANWGKITYQVIRLFGNWAAEQQQPKRYRGNSVEG